jgi:hypothetical protein
MEHAFLLSVKAKSSSNFHSSFICADMLSDIILPLKILPETLIFSLLPSQWTISFCLGRPACDVAISSLGWISVEPVSKSIKISDPNLEETNTELQLTVHVPNAHGQSWSRVVSRVDREERRSKTKVLLLMLVDP